MYLHVETFLFKRRIDTSESNHSNLLSFISLNKSSLWLLQKKHYSHMIDLYT